jgi:hypothetical protein
LFERGASSGPRLDTAALAERNGCIKLGRSWRAAAGDLVLALYRFWPEAREATIAAFAAARALPLAANAITVRAALRTFGAYDLVAVCDGPFTAERAASRAFTVAHAVSRCQLHRDPGHRPGYWCEPIGLEERPAHPLAAATFEALPNEVPVLLLRALGGWNLVAAPDDEVWRALSMTFLNRRAHQRLEHRRGWHSPDLNELATLVLGTHHSVDVEGTCLTYGIPGLSLPEWADSEERLAAAPIGPALSPPAQLAEQLEYAALLDIRGDPAASPGDYLREHLAQLGSDIRVAASGVTEG